MATTTTTPRFDTLEDAFLYSSTQGGIIHRYHREYYVVDFTAMEWAFACGMRIEDDFSAIM